MEIRRPLSIKWGIGVLVFLALLFLMNAYIGTVSEEIEKDSPGYNVSAYLLFAILTAISAILLIRPMTWSEWFTVITLCVVNVASITSGIQLLIKDYSFLPYFVQSIVWGIPIFYLAYCIGWGSASNSYFNNVKTYNEEFQRTNR